MKKLRKKFDTRLGLILGFVLLTLTVLTLPHLLAAAIGVQTALLFTSALVDQGSGKLGDMVLSHNRNGNYIRRYVKPQQPHTGNQTFYRGMVRQYAQAWQGATIDRPAWTAAGALINVIGKLGKSHTMTGFDLFMKTNVIAQEVSPASALILTPPSPPTLFPLLSGMTLATNTGPDLFTIMPIKIGDYIAGMKLQVATCAQRSAGVSSIPKMSLLGNYSPAPTTATDITTDYTAKYGALIVGKKIFVQIRLVMPTGEEGIKTVSTVIVATTPA